MTKKFLSVQHTIIEQTAAEFAAVIYETGRAQGMTSKYKTPRAYARAYFEKYVPKAIEHLTSMLGRSDINDLLKQQIYDAIIERTSDEEVNSVFPGHKQTTSPLQNVAKFEPTRH